MKSPLVKRIPGEFRHDIGKYLSLFIFMTLFIGMISAFIITDSSFLYIYNRSFSEKKIEDGHFSFNIEAPAEITDELSEKCDVTVYPYFYFEENIENTEKTIRIYSTKRDINLLTVMSGRLPSEDDEIALDRMFAENNDINVGDRIVLKEKELTVSGYIASPDYSALFENNSDMMFDSFNFSVAVMSEEGFTKFDSPHITYNYAWLFPQFIERDNTAQAKEMSDKFMNVFENAVAGYNKNVIMNNDGSTILNVTDFLPRYANQAINFTGEDMGGDKILFVIFDYILTVVLAFVFAVIISNTITTDAGVIGTLRASGYTKGELLAHYIVLPVLTTFISALTGNILGYTVFGTFFTKLYYSNYSLPQYKALRSAEAFILTTVIPIAIMFVINIAVVSDKLKLSPLRLIRHDLKKNKHRKAIRLNTKSSFINRFRTRIIFQNIPDYITMFFGILIGGVLVIFGTMFGPLLSDYRELIVNDRICSYQYILSEKAETSSEKAEKYAVTSLKTTDKRFVEDEISVFGIENDSRYVFAGISDGKIAVSNGIAEKFGLRTGDTFTLKEQYNDNKIYDFTVGTIYKYNSGLAIFMTRNDYCKKFNESPDYFSGYFSNIELTDIDENNIASVITVFELTKVSDQITASLNGMMGMFKWLGVIVFALLMFIISKQVIEKNATSISMTKILGFSNGEIGSLYIIATSVAAVLSLLVSMPFINIIIHFLFNILIYKKMTGYIPFKISAENYIEMFILGICCYALTAIVQMRKIHRIPKSDALKNVE